MIEIHVWERRDHWVEVCCKICHCWAHTPCAFCGQYPGYHGLDGHCVMAPTVYGRRIASGVHDYDVVRYCEDAQ